MRECRWGHSVWNNLWSGFQRYSQSMPEVSSGQQAQCWMICWLMNGKATIWWSGTCLGAYAWWSTNSTALKQGSLLAIWKEIVSDSREAVCEHHESQRVAFFTLGRQVRTTILGQGKIPHLGWDVKKQGLSAFPPMQTKGVSMGIFVNFLYVCGGGG